MTKPASSVSFPALGSLAVVCVADRARLDVARAEVERTVAEFDVACSRFRDDSDLIKLNAAAGTEASVSPLLLDAVDEALRAARLTDGDVDPTVGQALIALGYDRDFDELGRAASHAGGAPHGNGGPHSDGRGNGARRSLAIVPVPGWRTVRLHRERSTIRLSCGVKLDLGATAKALAADRAVASAGEAAGCGVLVGLGGDISTYGQAPDEGWHIRVTDDHRAGLDAPGQTITIRSGGLATSSTTVRRWRKGTAVVNHLVDPASGRSVTGVWRTASVTAANCLDANIASTAAVVRGTRAIAWLQSLGLPSRLVSTAGMVTHVAGWPTGGDDLDVSPELTGAPA